MHVTHSPDTGDAFTLFLVPVAGLALGLLNDIVSLLPLRYDYGDCLLMITVIKYLESLQSLLESL